MGRQIRTNEDLSGQTLDVRNLPGGHARQSYINNCDLRNATIVGISYGSDLLYFNPSPQAIVEHTG